LVGRGSACACGRALFPVEAPFKRYQIIGKRLAGGLQFGELLTNARMQLMHILRLVLHLLHEHGNFCL
jgi:hypothetical protein